MSMTVKHIDTDGRERVFPVDSVERTPDGDLVFGLMERIKTGRVYVMNDSGKTVATYDFDQQKEKK